MKDLPNVPAPDPSPDGRDEPDSEEGVGGVLDDISGAQAHCPHCLEPVDPEQYYCGNCRQAISGLVGILPFMNIPFLVNFFGAAWRRLWAKGTSLPMRCVCAGIVLCYLIIYGPVWLPWAVRLLLECVIVLLLIAGIIFRLKARSRPASQDEE